MKLHLPVPADWPQEESAGRRLIRPHASDALRIVIDPMEPLPPLREAAWLLERVRRDIPPGAELVVRKSIAETTRLGWPTNVLDIQIVERDTLRLIEQRITTCYRFLEYCVIAEVRARDLTPLFAHKDELRAIFAEGRPDWTGSDISLAWLLAGIER